MAGTEDTTTNIFAEMCDATASGAEYATKIVVFPSGGVLYLCAHHARKHGAEMLIQGAVVSEIVPNSPPDEPSAGQPAITPV
jgi:hypothetical protein